MKVLAFNCSPKAAKSNTGLVLDSFLRGVTEAGGEVELRFTRDLKVRPCTGCLHCWFKKPGVCIHKDHMVELYPKLKEAYLWVFSTPVYFDGVSGPMKNLMDRMVPLILPFVDIKDGHCVHRRREGVKQGKVVLVSTCGFWERDNFDPMVAHLKAFCRTIGRDYAGAVLRPTGDLFKGLLERGRGVDDILEAARAAGGEMVRDGGMAGDTLATISRELMPRDKFVQSSNKVCEQHLAKAEQA